MDIGGSSSKVVIEMLESCTISMLVESSLLIRFELITIFQSFLALLLLGVPLLFV